MTWNLPGLVKLVSLPLASTFPEPEVAVAVVAPQASEALRDFLIGVLEDQDPRSI